MVIKSNTHEVELRGKMRDGDGAVTLTTIAKNGAGLPPKSRLFSDITIPVGAFIGPHEHVGETELFYILAGEGVVNDNGTEAAVFAGDTIVTANGQSHSIRNTGKTELRMIALIVLD